MARSYIEFDSEALAVVVNGTFVGAVMYDDPEYARNFVEKIEAEHGIPVGSIPLVADGFDMYNPQERENIW